MPIIVNLDAIMAKRKISLNELSERVSLTLSNLSIFHYRHFRIRFTYNDNPPIIVSEAKQSRLL
jgi:DNA-binding Xre family transcriptional regulator